MRRVRVRRMRIIILSLERYSFWWRHRVATRTMAHHTAHHTAAKSTTTTKVAKATTTWKHTAVE
jgi:hypothetical protein